ncbi:MAG: hypothetical protein JWO38_333 [Gemmataceae bacterium]|nr:hypothetical protein [Gemmataceae bacterium]
MPITLYLTGRASLVPQRLTRAEARDWLANAAVWFEGLGDAVLDARVVRDPEEKPVLLVVLHPASPPVEVRLGGNGRVRLSALTSPAGPGYHVHLCDRVRQFAADFDLTWDDSATNDPTGYFTSNDRPGCERQFLRWLAGVCGAAVDHRSDTPTYVGLTPARGFTGPGPVLTPLGPRARDWLGAVATDPARGRDFFAWWAPAADAEFYRNRALTRLWCDFPWRPPLTEDEGELTDQVANDLATAYKLDPAGELPWREWLEVLAAIENDSDGHTITPSDPSLTEAVTQRAWEADPADPVIGYRRFPVRVSLCGGWSIEVPGDFAREWDDERTWTGWNATRTVWFHAVGFTKKDGTRPTSEETVGMGRRSLPDGEPVPGIDRDGLQGEAVFGEAEEDGRRVWRLSGVTAAEGQLVVCHAYTGGPDDRDWAVRTWHSLRHGN